MKSKKNKKKKFKDLDANLEEYDEEKEKEEINEVLRLLQKTFNYTDDEMTELLNYEFLDEDLRDIDRLVSILLNKDNEFVDEDKKEKEEETEKENIPNEKKKKSQLKEFLESIDKKFINDENMNNFEEKKADKKPYKVVNFNIKKAKEFLKLNENKKQIDLHGFTLVQSMYIVDKKLESLEEKKIEDSLKEITLIIITGVGHHSPDHKPVLHPNLTIFLKKMKKYTVKGKAEEGNIFVTIY